MNAAWLHFSLQPPLRNEPPIPHREDSVPFGATGPLLTCSASSGSRRGVPAPSTSRSLAPAAPPSRVWRRRAPRGGPPSLGNLAPPCRRPALLPGRGAPNSTGPFGHFRRALGSVRVRGGAGAPGRVRAELAGPSQCARAPAPLACSGGPSPSSPLPRERTSVLRG